MPINLDKVQQHAPGLVNLAKDATVSLAKHSLENHKANVIMILDVSGSTSRLYADGVIQSVANQAFMMSLAFDDDGEVPLCLFESGSHDAGVMTIENYQGYIDAEVRKVRMGGTSYADAISWGIDQAGFRPKKRRFGKSKSGNTSVPTYALFVTDGEPTDSRAAIQQQLSEASNYPIFWQFVGVGGVRFPFLESLDTMQGRRVDNAGFFAVSDPRTLTNEQMYNNLLSEYPSWLNTASAAGVLTSVATA